MKSPKTYRMTLGKQIFCIGGSVLFFLMPYAGALYIVINQHKTFISFFEIGLAGNFFLPLYVPGFILYINYYLKDKKREVIIDDDAVTILDTDTPFYKFNKDEIEIIDLHFTRHIQGAVWDALGFSVFKLKNGKNYLVTSLILEYGDVLRNFPKSILKDKNHFVAPLIKRNRVTNTYWF
jgi:hypothetical protein